MSVDHLVVGPGRAPMTPTAYRVAGRHEETATVVTVVLEPVAAAIEEPQPGQFTMLYAFGVGEVPISVSGCPADDGVLRQTVRAAGAVTQALCRLAPGDPIGVRGPFGVGWPLTAAEGHHLVVVGGGIGLAPLRPVMRRVIADRDRFERVALVVGARTPADLLYRSELASWRARFDVDVQITVDAAAPDWHGDVGAVTRSLPRLLLDPARTVALVCGPELMIRATVRHLLDVGLEAERVHVSLELNMRCALGQCGHCQLGPVFVCKDGPVLKWSTAGPLLEVLRR